MLYNFIDNKNTSFYLSATLLLRFLFLNLIVKSGRCRALGYFFDLVLGSQTFDHVSRENIKDMTYILIIFGTGLDELQFILIS